METIEDTLARFFQSGNSICPKTKRPLILQDSNLNADGRIKDGVLIEPLSGNEYPIVNHIPRFVDQENYSSNFGLEWNLHSRTQYDDDTGVPLSKKRFVEETRWESDLSGQIILEVGSGSGRFTTHALDTNALVVSFDFSNAVEANYASNGARQNLLLVQASVYEMPFPVTFFDKAFCFGVLQHTPDPRKALFYIVDHLKPGGSIAADIYAKNLKSWLTATRYYVRPFVRNMDPERLYRLSKLYVDFMWPLAKIIRKIPRFGGAINWRLLITDASYSFPNAPDEWHKEYAYLDIFDMLSPRYDKPQTLETFRRWYREAGLTDVDVRYGYCIEGRGVKSKNGAG
ncbi:MAG: methyltransferase domain-containing protein [Lentisphaerae bacterium]|nr:methyltransferase domain-containing protein [Lentisphaerota bacterium]